jgi:hypothetical protein
LKDWKWVAVPHASQEEVLRRGRERPRRIADSDRVSRRNRRGLETWRNRLYK